MTVHATLEYPEPVVLRFLRGEAAEMESAIVQQGIRARERPLAPGWPGERTLRYEGLPDELIPDLHADHFYEHVLESSRSSAMVSWSLNLGRALYYAFDGGRRDHGLLVELPVRIVKEHGAAAVAGWRWGHLEDDRERSWFSIAHFATNADAVVRPAALAEMRRLGAQDAEFLQWGDVGADEIRVHRVRRR